MKTPDPETDEPGGGPDGSPPRRGVPRWLAGLVLALAAAWIGLSLLVIRETLAHREDVARFGVAQDNYERYAQAAELLRTGSNILTEAARRYAVTGDADFLNAYFREADEDRNRDNAFAIVEKTGAAAAARDRLDFAMSQSLALMRTEYHAMRLVAEAEGLPERFVPAALRAVELSPREEALSPEDKRLRAARLLFDENYIAAKVAILGGANDFFDEAIRAELRNVRIETASIQRTAARQTIYFTLGLAALFGAIVVASAAAWRLLARQDRANLRLMGELRRERDATLAAEKAKSMFFSMVSHDIRTPLNSIVGFAELLRGGIDDPRERAESLENVLFSAQTLLALVNDVLDLSKLDAEKMKFTSAPVDFPKLLLRVSETFRFQTRKKGISIRAEAGPMPPLLLDEERMRQVLVNLASNAVKFTDKGGVDLRASFEREGASGRGTLRFSVADTGIGIAPEDRERVLEPFVQVEGSHAAGGTGLGLPICRRIVERLGGRLTLESEPGRGTTFTAELPGVAVAPDLPPADSGLSAPSAPSALPRPSLAVRSALVVDDVPVNLMVEKAMLAKAGVADIVTAGSGAAALEALEKHGAFDLVLTDLWMPEMDGYALCERLRADPRWKALPVFAVTADVEARKAAAERGFDGILLKPLTTAALAEFLAARGAGGAARNAD